MKKPFQQILLILPLFFSYAGVSAQSFTSYFTGDTTNVERSTVTGTVLMGGSTENDSAMVWWLKRAGGGDVLIIRASGSNGYNDYLFSELGQTVNSVETIVFANRQNSYDPYVIRRLAEAEALWIAGGDQGKYTSYWKNTPVDSLINWLIQVKKIPIGGTSAGMAIMGEVYFDALQGSVTSAEALANPYDPLVSIGRNDFVHNPLLKNTITDTHFDNPDRRGRLVAFLARMATDSGRFYRAIACEEKTAVCVDENGIGHVYGNNPAAEFAYFVAADCHNPLPPEICQPGQPLTWNNDGKALLVSKIPGTNSGTNTFNLNTWSPENIVTWQYWRAATGSFGSSNLPGNPCISSVGKQVISNRPAIFPNPARNHLYVSEMEVDASLEIVDALGHIVWHGKVDKSGLVPVANVPVGIYSLRKIGDSNPVSIRFAKD